MLNRFGNMLKVFLLLRVVELLFGVIALTTMVFLFGGDIDTVGGNNVGSLDDVWETIKFSSFFVLFYYILSSYIFLVFFVFLIAALLNQLKSNILPLLNSIPYAVHSLPIMLGFFGGEVPEIGLWLVWLSIILFNYLFPWFLRTKFSGMVLSG